MKTQLSKPSRSEARYSNQCKQEALSYGEPVVAVTAYLIHDLASWKLALLFG
jgi:hypothetical protein